MLVTAKSLSLIEQKKLQWAREREEMVGLYGLWGRPRNLDKNENKFPAYNRNNLLPPIEGKKEYEEQNKAEESETSGYLSDSPKHLNEKESNQERNYIDESNLQLNNETAQEEQQCWNEINNTIQDNYWAEKKMFKNYRNENWAHQNTEPYNHQRFYQTNRNFWQGTPDSLSSDDGSRLRWGDRGVGIGHLWEPVVNHPNCRLPLMHDSYRQTPKWVEKGLKNSDGNKADILVIHHPDYNQDDLIHKNYLLGQNAPIPLEIIEERERKRKKALEHQNAIKKQLEEREMKRKQERENRIREEKLEEERIRKEQEIERLRYEEEQRKIKQKEEIEKKKEEVMREAIQVAEKLAKEEKRLSKKHQMSGFNEKSHLENEKKLERLTEYQEGNSNFRKQIIKTPRCKRTEEKKPEDENKLRKENNEKTLKDSFSQSEEISLAQNFQLLNVNGLPVDGGLALMLDTPPKDNNFLLPPDGVQLALLMSPRNVSSTNHLINSPSISTSVNTRERILTPSKYRVTERLRVNPANKSTQTELKYSQCIKHAEITGRGGRQTRRWGANSGSSGASQKCNNGGLHKHIRCFLSSKYRSKPFSSKLNLEDRPKWGINRPSVQYKKQSEKDPYYQKKIKEKLKKAEVGTLSIGDIENTGGAKEKEMNSVVSLLDCQTDEEEKQLGTKEEILLQNGYRMNSNLSSPVFVPIASGLSEKLDLDSGRSKSNDSEQFDSGGNEEGNDDEENTAVPGSVGFLTLTQLKAIKQIASLREGLKKLQKDYSNSRSITPFSDKSLEKFLEMIKLDDFLTKKKEPAQALDLSKVKITSKEEFKKYLDKIPECKMKPEKILPDHIKIKDKEFSFTLGKKEEKQCRDWSYPDPTPIDMRGVKLEDLCTVNIDWKMLTTQRPKTKIEEDMFSRLVQLGKLDLKYQQALKREKVTDWVRKTKNPKSSIVEMRILSCKECGEDFCDSSMCSKLMYDYFFRPQATTSATVPNLLLGADATEPKKKKKKKKGKRKFRKRNVNKNRKTKLGKNSIFNRPISQGCNRDHFRRAAEPDEKPRVRALSSTRSFSTERMRTKINFFERRSKSAPKIHFEGDNLDSKSKRYFYASDSGPSQSDYSSHSDSESPDPRGRFFLSNLRLSGRRKLLSARVGFSGRNRTENSLERRKSKFVRKCTLYEGYHSDTSALDSQGDGDTSESSSPSHTSSPSKSPEKIFNSLPLKHPSTVRIQFEEDFETPVLKFPDKIFLPNRMANAKPKSRDVSNLKNRELKKIAEGFSKIELEFDEKLARTSKIFPQTPKTGICTHISRSRASKLSKFSGPYLKAKGLFEKKKV